jgi:MFS family permease
VPAFPRVVTGIVRGAAIGALALAVACSYATVPLVYAAFFVLGAGETVAGSAAEAYLPELVAPDRLPAANSRLAATFTIGNQLLAKPVGAGLFSVAAALPFGVDALSFGLAALLVSRTRAAPVPASTTERSPTQPLP